MRRKHMLASSRDSKDQQHPELLDVKGMSWGFKVLDLACRASLPCSYSA